MSFTNATVIMTTNVGAKAGGGSIGFVNGENGRRLETLSALKNTFRPEFLNRVDDIIVFCELTEEELTDIAKMLLSQFCVRANSSGVAVSADDGAARTVAALADKSTGARELRRIIARDVERPLSEMLLSGEIKRGDSVKISSNGERIVFIR